MSMRGVKRDPSSDLSYSSWNADKKSWASKGCFTSKSNRWATSGFAALHSLEKPNQVDAIYEPRKSLADEMIGSLRGTASMRSKQAKNVDVNTMRCNETRSSNTKVPFPYAKALGPGQYGGSELGKSLMYGPGSMFDSERPSACFTTLPRGHSDPVAGPDSSDILQRDRAMWTSKGFHTTHQNRFQPMYMINDSGKYRSMYNFGGTYGMTLKGRTPAFDAQYDTDSGGKQTISRNTQQGRDKYSNAFKSNAQRFKSVPIWKQADSRGSHADQATNEWIGPGTYDVPSVSIGTNNMHTGTQLAMFERTFRGSPRFRSPGSQSPYQDSALKKTW